MPIIEVKLNYEMEEKEEIVLLETITKVVSYEMKKPISKVMCFIETSKGVMNVNTEPLVLVSIKCLGKIGMGTKEDVCHALLKVLQIVIPVTCERIYINFMPIEASCMWQFCEGNPVCSLSKEEGEQEGMIY